MTAGDTCGCTCAETSLRLVSPFPEGWSIAEELTSRSTRLKLALTRSAASRTSSSRFTSSLRVVSLPRCCPARLRSSADLSGFRHVAMTAARGLFVKTCLQNSSPSPLLAPCMRAMGAAMTGILRNTRVKGEVCLLPSGSTTDVVSLKFLEYDIRKKKEDCVTVGHVSACD